MKEVNEAFGDMVCRVDALEVAKELDENRSCFGDTKNKSKENAVFYLRSQYEQIQLLTKHAKELQSRLESLEKTKESLCKALDEAGDSLIEAGAKIEALEKDAAQRELRLETIRALYPSAPSDTELDLAIDAAMKSSNTAN